jgi:L-ascorbate metabolism protein UlaG (beta-lactamase superfamily)
MKVTLIHHSGVLIELAHKSLLFDYYEGQLTVNPDKPLYIFASHAHYDHYSSKIFHIKHPQKTYILSDDIKTHHAHLSVSPHNTYHVDDIEITTLFSTDQGVAYVIHTEGKSLYFAGDLHYWYWIGEPDKDNAWQRDTYLKEISTLTNEHFDLSCVVVDDRLESAMYYGLEAFLKRVKTDYVLPIHYFGNYAISKHLKKEFVSDQTILLYPDYDGFTVTL